MDRFCVEQAYELAKKRYASIGIDTAEVLERLANIALSIHCWQGDDVAGFENDAPLDGGISATGNYPGRAGSGADLRKDIDKMLSFVAGKHKISLHAIYAEDLPACYERSQVKPEYFHRWVEWAKERGLGLDFNGTFFSHPMASDGMTLAHPDQKVREYWIEHAINSRKVGEYFGRELGRACVTNLWVPDGYKDIPVDRLAPRKRLMDALDRVFALPIDKKYNIDAVESKVFGIASESYVVGSHEFYMGYAMKNNVGLTLDTGHFHPTETVSNKLSAASIFVDDILLHISRPVRWDSDHVVILDDELNEVARELVRGDYMDRVHIGLDFFDGSINRIAAWVIGIHSTQKALMKAMLEPTEMLRGLELGGDYSARLMWLEETKCYPFGAVWDYFCMINNVPAAGEWFEAVRDYEKSTLSLRD